MSYLCLKKYLCVCMEFCGDISVIECYDYYKISKKENGNGEFSLQIYIYIICFNSVKMEILRFGCNKRTTN